MHTSFNNIKGTYEESGGSLVLFFFLLDAIRSEESLEYRFHVGLLPYSPLPVQCQGWSDTPSSQKHKLPMPHYHQEAKQ